MLSNGSEYKPQLWGLNKQATQGFTHMQIQNSGVPYMQTHTHTHACTCMHSYLDTFIAINKHAWKLCKKMQPYRIHFCEIIWADEKIWFKSHQLYNEISDHLLSSSIIKIQHTLRLEIFCLILIFFLAKYLSLFFIILFYCILQYFNWSELQNHP